jgi:SAM-dependent methyltransferase
MRNPWNEDEPFDYSGVWLGCRSVQRHVNRKTTGDAGLDWFAGALRSHLAVALGASPGGKPQAEYRCLMLGASEGGRVRQLCEAGFVGEIVATDIADRALGRAEQALKGRQNVRFVVADLNEHRFDGPFDFIVAEGVLHHVENIEPCLRHLHELLEPGGLLVAVEFVGPVRFQLPERQVRWINAALGALPGGLRPLWEGDPELPTDLGYQGRVHFVVPDEEAIRAIDPSEAISGVRLNELLPQIFTVITRRGFGGTLLSYMTGHFPFSRADSDPFVDRFLRMLLEIEDSLIETGVLEDEFVYYELGPKATGPRPSPQPV